ncbi:efflux transporter outer membrane subunit [Pseudomonas aeruginosa]
MRDQLSQRVFLAVAPTLMLAACAVGPAHRTPAPPADLPAQFARAAVTQSDGVPAEVDLEFWRSFQDARLTALVEQALAANHDLARALARYDGANALLRESGFDRLPTVTANAQGSRTRRTADEASGQPRTVQRVGGVIEANWELDFVGRVRRNIEAHGAEAAASAADLATLQIAIVGEVASTYVELRGLQERLRVALENLQTQQSTLTLVTTRLDAGRGTVFDTARARAQLENTASRVPALETQIAVHQHRLAVLTGRTPQALIAELGEPTPQLVLPPEVDPGTPAALLRRRPDVRAAEERLHAATARVGVATADLFPRVSLGGLIGTFAPDGSGLLRNASETSSALLGIDWSFLDVGRVRARIAASEADAGAALAEYQQAVLRALENTENALVQYDRTRAEDAHLARAAREGDIALQLARTRMDLGNIDLFEVLDTQRTQLAAQDAWADSRMRSLRAAVALHQALAGGWPQLPANSAAATKSITPVATVDRFTHGESPSATVGTAGFHPATSAPTETTHAR